MGSYKGEIKLKVLVLYISCMSSLLFLARLFKTNEVVSLRFVKISNVLYLKLASIFFFEKLREAFALQ